MEHVTDKEGQKYLFREIAAEDGMKLGDYFVSLSEETTSRFGPHSLTRDYAKDLCKNIGNDQTVRYILIDSDSGEIAGYFILQYEIPHHDIERYYEYEVQLVPRLDPLFAPSIGDRYQNRGLASAVMPFIIREAECKGARSIVLMGGTQVTNDIAIAFYEKQGFKKFGEYQTEIVNYDMMLVLDDKK